MRICTYNVRTLTPEEKHLKLEEKLNKIKWDIIGLSEVCKKGENVIKLQCHNLCIIL